VLAVEDDLQAVECQVGRDGLEPARNGDKPTRSPLRIRQRGGMVEADDNRLTQGLEPPRPRVEPSPDDHDLFVPRLGDCLVDRDRARNDNLGTRPQGLDGEPLAPIGWFRFCAGEIDELELVASEKLGSDRVGEAADGEAAVGDCTPLANEYGRLACLIAVHSTSPRICLLLHGLLLERVRAAGQIEWTRASSTLVTCRRKGGRQDGPEPG
jgi:hypothetical protein